MVIRNEETGSNVNTVVKDNDAPTFSTDPKIIKYTLIIQLYCIYINSIARYYNPCMGDIITWPIQIGTRILVGRE